MSGVGNAAAGIVGQDDGSRDARDKANAEIAASKAKADANAKMLEDLKARQQAIADQNKVDSLRRRKGLSSLLNSDYSSDASQTKLG